MFIINDRFFYFTSISVIFFSIDNVVKFTWKNRNLDGVNNQISTLHWYSVILNPHSTLDGFSNIKYLYAWSERVPLNLNTPVIIGADLTLWVLNEEFIRL